MREQVVEENLSRGRMRVSDSRDHPRRSSRKSCISSFSDFGGFSSVGSGGASTTRSAHLDSASMSGKTHYQDILCCFPRPAPLPLDAGVPRCVAAEARKRDLRSDTCGSSYESSQRAMSDKTHPTWPRLPPSLDSSPPATRPIRSAGPFPSSNVMVRLASLAGY